MDTYIGNLNVEPTAGLNPFLVEYAFSNGSTIPLCINESPLIPTITYAQAATIIRRIATIRNDGDEPIEAQLRFVTNVVTINPGETKVAEAHVEEDEMFEGEHTIGWALIARVPGNPWKYYYSASTTYTVEHKPCTCTPWANVECTAVGKRRQTRTCTPPGCDIEERIIDDVSCRADGDITRVTLDGKLLPEGGTLNWIVNDDAAVKIYFKNTGTVASAFHIYMTDETGSTITGDDGECDITTGAIAADGVEYYVDLCIFLPEVVKLKTLTAHIESI